MPADSFRHQRCCFAGHRPEKLSVPEEEAKAWMSAQIDCAIDDGYVTFITGCGMGADIWAAQIVIGKRAHMPSLHLITATPYPGFGYRWKEPWKTQYIQLLKNADLVKTLSPRYTEDCLLLRDRWIVDHASRLIALSADLPGNTLQTIAYARKSGLEVIHRIA